MKCIVAQVEQVASVEQLAPIAPRLPLDQTLLEQVQQLAHQADWGGVVQQLTRWLQGDGTVPAMDLDQLPAATRAEWLSLAIQVLEEGDFQLRWDVGKLLPRFDREAMTALLELLNDDATDPDVRWFAVRALADFPDPAVIPTLLQTIQTATQPELPQAAAQVLSAMGTQVMPLLDQLLEQPASRPIAVQVLAQMRQPQAIPPLLALSKDRDATIRAAAIDALSGFHTPEIAQVLQQALADPDSAVRLTAVRSVGFCWRDLPDDQWLPRLQPLLRDRDLAVCRQAALTLGRLGNLGAIQALATVLQSPDTPEPLAIDIIRSLCWTEQREAVSTLSQIWATIADREPLQQTIIEHLGRIETPVIRTLAATHLLDWFAQDAAVARSSQLRQVLITALGRLGDRRAIAVMLPRLTTEPPRLQLHLLAALKQLDPSQSYDHLLQ
jgi:HEAT repeat protein